MIRRDQPNNDHDRSLGQNLTRGFKAYAILIGVGLVFLYVSFWWTDFKHPLLWAAIGAACMFLVLLPRLLGEIIFEHLFDHLPFFGRKTRRDKTPFDDERD